MFLQIPQSRKIMIICLKSYLPCTVSTQSWVVHFVLLWSSRVKIFYVCKGTNLLHSGPLCQIRIAIRFGFGQLSNSTWRMLVSNTENHKITRSRSRSVWYDFHFDYWASLTSIRAMARCYYSLRTVTRMLLFGAICWTKWSKEIQRYVMFVLYV